VILPILGPDLLQQAVHVTDAGVILALAIITGAARPMGLIAAKRRVSRDGENPVR
jgi:hypothetical protein